jgi:hypothetical protein
MAGDGRQPFTGRDEFLETSGDLYMGVSRHAESRIEAEMERLTVDEAPGLKKRVAAVCARSLNFCSNRTPATWSIGWLESANRGKRQRFERARLQDALKGHDFKRGGALKGHDFSRAESDPDGP